MHFYALQIIFWFRNILWKWSLWKKKMLHFCRSVWTYARHCQASRWPSPLPCPLGTASPSLWTPVERKLRLPKQGRKPHLLWKEMPGEETSLWRKNWKLQLAIRFVMRKFPSVTNVATSSNLKMGWRSMLENLTKQWTQLHLIAWGSSPGAQWASLPPPSVPTVG